jgi:hypothetical protein
MFNPLLLIICAIAIAAIVGSLFLYDFLKKGVADDLAEPLEETKESPDE